MMIIKIGGGKTINHKAIIKDLANIESKFIVVHGANALRNEIAKKMNHEINNITSPSGYSSVLTDDNAMDIFLMSYAGLRNKRLVELAQECNINAIGLTGIDGGLITGKRKTAIKAKIGNKVKMIRDDLSGRPNKINTELINLLLNNNTVPFLCPPILSEEGKALNTENDSIVSLLAKELDNVKTIIHFIEAPGLLQDLNNENSLIKKIARQELEHVEEKYTKGRMKRKMLSIREAFENEVEKVIFADGRIENPVTNALKGKCTTIE